MLTLQWNLPESRQVVENNIANHFINIIYGIIKQYPHRDSLLQKNLQSFGIRQNQGRKNLATVPAKNGFCLLLSHLNKKGEVEKFYNKNGQVLFQQKNSVNTRTSNLSGKGKNNTDK